MPIIHAKTYVTQYTKIMGVQYQEFSIIIERDEDDTLIGEVPQLQACYSEGKAIDELLKNMKEVSELCLEEKAKSTLGITVLFDIEKVKLLTKNY